MEKYESKHVRIRRPASMIYSVLSRFDNLTPVQLVSVDEQDTRMRIVLHVQLNMMMKMMIGGKLAQAVDQIADQIAEAFNNAPV